MKRACIVSTLILSVSAGAAQVRPTGTMELALVRERHKTLFGALGMPEPKNAIALFKLTYASRDPRGRSTTLSALVAVPKGVAPRGLVVYCHGTQTERAQSPSKFSGKNGVAEAEAAVLGLATGPYVVLLPDYLGHGDHPGVHPYPMGSVNADGVLDAVRALRKVPGRPFALGSKLFVTGYSEGGAVAMWSTRKMESASDFDFGPDYSVPMSGPYDLQDTIVDWLTSKTTDGKLYAFKVLGLAYSAYGLQRNRPGLKLDDFFVPSFASYVPKVFGGDETKIAQRLLVKAVQLGALQQVDRIVQPKFLKAMQERDRKNPLVAAFVQNTCLDWTPRTPMTLVYLPTDTVVVQRHTLKAVAEFRRRGILEDQVKVVALPPGQLGHVTAMVPALSVARRAFDGR
ncbi:MAG: alpha/beta fold hydrolase [Armatimonadetes bacterium]|nr:alpha/beta fold hydrolase [Armatimonadota bacterium]